MCFVSGCITLIGSFKRESSKEPLQEQKHKRTAGCQCVRIKGPFSLGELVDAASMWSRTKAIQVSIANELQSVTATEAHRIANELAKFPWAR